MKTPERSLSAGLGGFFPLTPGELNALRASHWWRADCGRVLGFNPVGRHELAGDERALRCVEHRLLTGHSDGSDGRQAYHYSALRALLHSSIGKTHTHTPTLNHSPKPSVVPLDAHSVGSEGSCCLDQGCVCGVGCG